MHARTGPPQLKRRLAFDRGRLAPPPAMDHRWGKQPTESVNQFQRFFLSELILHYTENLEDVFDKLNYEDIWDITVNYDTSRWPLNHNSVRVKPRNPQDPLVDADTWKGCFSVTWPHGSSQKDFKRCFTCKELLNK